MNLAITTVSHPRTALGRALRNFARSRRAAYLSYRLRHVEKDIEVNKANTRLWESQAEEMRAELASLGELRHG